MQKRAVFIIALFYYCKDQPLLRIQLFFGQGHY
jgi:hypothetical protein